jgi:hypothetical protein
VKKNTKTAAGEAGPPTGFERPPPASLADAIALLEREGAKEIERARAAGCSQKELDAIVNAMDEYISRLKGSVARLAQSRERLSKPRTKRPVTSEPFLAQARKVKLQRLRDELDPGADMAQPDGNTQKRILRRIRALAQRAASAVPTGQRAGIAAIALLATQLEHGNTAEHVEVHRLIAGTTGQAAASARLLAAIKSTLDDAAGVDATIRETPDYEIDDEVVAVALESLGFLVPGAKQLETEETHRVVEAALQTMRLPDGRGRDGAGRKKAEAVRSVAVQLGLVSRNYSAEAAKKAIARGGSKRRV